MKVLHLPLGRDMVTLCEALRRIGVDATSCHFRRESLRFQADLCLHFENLSASERAVRRREFLEFALKEYDIFHFHYGKTFFTDRSDLEKIVQQGKKVIMQHLGSDVRMLSKARSAQNPYVRVKKEGKKEEEQMIAKLKHLSSYIHHAIVFDHELLSYVEPYYKHVHILRQAIDLRKFEPCYPSMNPTSIKVIHAPTNPALKGTDYVIRVLRRLQRHRYPIEYQIIRNMEREKALQCYPAADIIIDQLLIGSIGVFGLEGMALGKPVVCFIRDDLIDTYPSKLPVMNANPDNLYRQVRKLVRHPELRQELAIKGRKYVETYHDSIHIAKQLKALYGSI